MGIEQRPGVTSRLLGQLGNQLFCYFAAAALASRQGLNVNVDGFLSSRTDGRISLRACSLPILGQFRGDHRIVGALVGSARRKGFHVAVSDAREHLVGRVIFRPSVVGYAGALNDLEGQDVVLDGYFQTYRYVEEVRISLGLQQSELVKVAVPSPWLLDIRDRASKIAPIGLHVRIASDYRSAGISLDIGTHVVTSLKTMGLLSTRQPIWLFSDDPEYALDRIPRDLRNRIEVITAPVGTPPIEVMIALASAHDLIISNSTFSWWSAYLSGHNRVVAPYPWMPPNEDPECDYDANLVPAEWRTVDAAFRNS